MNGGALVFRVECRRRPTLPHPTGCSTIGAGGLSYRVRDGTGRTPSATTTDTTNNQTINQSIKVGLPVGGWLCAQGHTVDANTRNVWVSPRPISTGRLHPSQGFHLQPINPIVCGGP